MALYARLTANDSTRIAKHPFMAAVGELKRGKATSGQVAAFFGLSAPEEAELVTLAAKVIEPPESYPLGAFVTLTNVGATFDSTPAAKGLGFLAVDTAGITRLEVRTRYNKIGTGTLSWQLWDDTNAAPLGIFDDAAAAGDNKTATIVVTPAQPMSAGLRLIRMRVQSTVAGDDPLYYGSCVFINRAERLTSLELHEILLLTDARIAYATEAALKARLGIA
jgi:hypothetical protein